MNETLQLCVCACVCPRLISAWPSGATQHFAGFYELRHMRSCRINRRPLLLFVLLLFLFLHLVLLSVCDDTLANCLWQQHLAEDEAPSDKSDKLLHIIQPT